MSLALNGCEWTKEQVLSRLPAQSTVMPEHVRQAGNNQGPLTSTKVQGPLEFS